MADNVPVERTKDITIELDGFEFDLSVQEDLSDDEVIAYVNENKDSLIKDIKQQAQQTERDLGLDPLFSATQSFAENVSSEQARQDGPTAGFPEGPFTRGEIDLMPNIVETNTENVLSRAWDNVGPDSKRFATDMFEVVKGLGTGETQEGIARLLVGAAQKTVPGRGGENYEGEVDAMKDMLSEQYGSSERFLHSFAERPVTTMSDISGWLSTAFGAAGKMATAANMSRTAKGLNTVGALANAVDPVNATATMSKAVLGVAMKPAAKMAETIVNSDLGLTKGQMTKFREAHGVSAGKWLLDKGIPLGSNDATLIALGEMAENSYNAVDKALDVYDQRVIDISTGRPKTLHNFEQVDVLLERLENHYKSADLRGADDIIKQSDRASELRAKHRTEGLTLREINETKRLADQQLPIIGKAYTSKADDLAQDVIKENRKKVQAYIEDAVGGDANIKELNSQVQASYAIRKAAMESTDGWARNKILGLRDAMLLGMGDPVFGAGALVTKKVLQTELVQGALAKGLDALTAPELREVERALVTGKETSRSLAVGKKLKSWVFPAMIRSGIKVGRRVSEADIPTQEEPQEPGVAGSLVGAAGAIPDFLTKMANIRTGRAIK